jgi:hypothetical protein
MNLKRVEIARTDTQITYSIVDIDNDNTFVRYEYEPVPPPRVKPRYEVMYDLLGVEIEKIKTDSKTEIDSLKVELTKLKTEVDLTKTKIVELDTKLVKAESDIATLKEKVK